MMTMPSLLLCNSTLLSACIACCIQSCKHVSNRTVQFTLPKLLSMHWAGWKSLSDESAGWNEYSL